MLLYLICMSCIWFNLNNNQMNALYLDGFGSSLVELLIICISLICQSSLLRLILMRILDLLLNELLCISLCSSYLILILKDV